MRSLVWRLAWLGLASMLVMGGCPNGGPAQQGVIPGKYIGTLTCTMTGSRTDGVPVTPSTYPFGGSAEVTSDGKVYVYEIERYPGATTSGWMGGTYITDTVESVNTNSDSVVINGPVTMTAGTVVAHGSENITIQQSGLTAVSMTHYLTVATDDGGLSLTQTCAGELTQ